MGMTKKIEIDGKEVLFKASAAIPRIYRIKFQRDIYKDLSALEKAIGKNVEDASTLDTFSLEMFENIAYVMAKHADANIPDEAIISHEIFDQAAAAMEQRAKEKNIEIGHEKYQNRYAFSGRILCGDCGSTFKRRQHYKPSGSYVAWTCNLHLENKEACSMLYIHDEAIKNAFVRMMRKLQAADNRMLKPFVAGLKGTNNKDRLHQMMDLEAAIEKNTEQQMVLVNLMSAGYLEPEVFHLEKNQLSIEADDLAKEKELISKKYQL